MLNIEKPQAVHDQLGKYCGKVYAVMSDAATIRAWIADDIPGSQIAMIPYDTRQQATDACIRLAGGLQRA